MRKITMKYKIALLFFLFISISSNGEAQSLEGYISQYNQAEARIIAREIEAAGRKYSIDPLFLSAVFRIESAYNNTAISPAGAIGISQLMPDTAEEVGANPYNIKSNIDGGSKYLRKMINAHKDKGVYQYNYALASYNAGLGQAGDHIPTFTYDYIQNIQDEYYKQKKIIRNSGYYNRQEDYYLQKKRGEQKKLLQKLKQLKELRRQKRCDHF